MSSVKSAARVLELLELLVRQSEPIGVNEIARRLSMPSSSTSGLVATLEEHGYVTVGSDGVQLVPAYRGVNWIGGMTGFVMRSSRPVMKSLSQERNESCFLAVLTESFNVQFIEKAVSNRELRIDLDATVERSAYCTTAGMVLLAGMSDAELDTYFATHELKAFTAATMTDEREVRKAILQVAEVGYSTLTDTSMSGVSGVGVPIYSNGKVVAALSLMGPRGRFLEHEKANIDAAVAAGKQITKALSYANESVKKEPA